MRLVDHVIGRLVPLASHGVNITNSSTWNNCNRNQLLKQEDSDLSQVTSYNCHKNGYFANQYTKPHKPKN